MDDILIAAKTLTELRATTKTILNRLEENDLYANADKCVFEVEEIDFLGVHIKNGKVQIMPK